MNWMVQSQKNWTVTTHSYDTLNQTHPDYPSVLQQNNSKTNFNVDKNYVDGLYTWQTSHYSTGPNSFDAWIKSYENHKMLSPINRKQN